MEYADRFANWENTHVISFHDYQSQLINVLPDPDAL